MRILGVDEKLQNTSVALGMFDGMHIGHRAIINEAAFGGSLPVAVTFVEHPKKLLFNKPVLRLTTPDEKERLLSDAGISYIMYLDPPSVILKMSPEEFFNFLLMRLSPKRIIVGYNYRFGKNASGDATLLEKLCAGNGIGVFVLPPVMMDDEAVSSSRIREALMRNELAEANKMLGYPYVIREKVIHGYKRGRCYDIPTANLRLDSEKCLPGGVFAGFAQIDGSAEKYKAVISIGCKPTFSDESISIEANILDFGEEIYDSTITLSLVSRLRDIKKFDDSDKLFIQITSDIETTKSMLK